MKAQRLQDYGSWYFSSKMSKLFSPLICIVRNVIISILLLNLERLYFTVHPMFYHKTDNVLYMYNQRSLLLYQESRRIKKLTFFMLCSLCPCSCISLQLIPIGGFVVFHFYSCTMCCVTTWAKLKVLENIHLKQAVITDNWTLSLLYTGVWWNSCQPPSLLFTVYELLHWDTISPLQYSLIY